MLTKFISNKRRNLLLIRSPQIITKRTAMRMTGVVRSQTSLVARINANRVLQRNYPGQYRAGIVTDDLKKSNQNPIDPSKKDYNHERDDANLSQHQATHTNIEEVSTKQIRAIFTSAKKNKEGKPFVKIDSVKADGSFTPLLDPKAKKPFLDQNGDQIPDPNKGGQYVAILQTPRKACDDMATKMPYDDTLQPYLDKHEAKISAAIQAAKFQRNPVLPKLIGGKEDEPKR